MLFSTSAVAVALTSIAAVNAQTYWNIDPTDLDLGTKQIWCMNQMASCTLLCLDQESGGGFTNDCWPEDLTYQCICSDNTVPNATEYSQTIPYFLCTYQIENCVQNCGQSDPTCAQKCKTGKTCGASNPSRVRSSSSTSASKTSAKPTATGANGEDDVAFDAEPTDNAERTNTPSDDDTAAVTDSQPGETSRPSAANRLSSISGGAMAFSVMMLSVACGAFVFQV